MAQILSLCNSFLPSLSKGTQVKNNLSEASTGLFLGEELVVFVLMSGDLFQLSLGEDLAIEILFLQNTFPSVWYQGGNPLLVAAEATGELKLLGINPNYRSTIKEIYRFIYVYAP